MSLSRLVFRPVYASRLERPNLRFIGSGLARLYTNKVSEIRRPITHDSDGATCPPSEDERVPSENLDVSFFSAKPRGRPSSNFSRVLGSTVTLFLNVLLLYMSPSKVRVWGDRKEFCRQTVDEMETSMHILRGYFCDDIETMFKVPGAQPYVAELSNSLVKKIPERDPMWSSMLPTMYHDLWGDTQPHHEMTRQATRAWIAIEKAVRELYRVSSDAPLLDFSDVESEIVITKAWQRIYEAIRDEYHEQGAKENQLDGVYDRVNSIFDDIYTQILSKNPNEKSSPKLEGMHLGETKVGYQRSFWSALTLSTLKDSGSSSGTLTSAKVGPLLKDGKVTDRKVTLILDGEKGVDPRFRLETDLPWIKGNEGRSQFLVHIVKDFKELVEKQKQRVMKLENTKRINGEASEQRSEAI